ncbi:MAG: ABC transporter substrate-binding protein [Acidobacteria bacterium]|nr:ABC transporter substrate-binding protein [Acidobacteriota bacterium]
MLDFAKLVAAGLSETGWGDQQLVWETLIQDLNDRGGINGRNVEAVYQYYLPTSEAEAEAACLKFTEDIDAFAVLGGFLGPVEPSNVCVARAPDTTLIAGQGLDAERLEEAQAPWLISGAANERLLDTLVFLLDDNGDLEGKKIAVVGGNEAENIYESAGDVLGEYGVEPVLEVKNTAASGDIPAGDAEWSVIAEQIIASDADTVMLIGSVTAGIRGIKENALDVDIWTPSAGELGNLGASIDPEDADGTISVIGLTAQEIWDEEISTECRARFSALQPDIELLSPSEIQEGDEEWYISVHNYCRWLTLFELVMTDAGVNPTQDSFGEAAANMGEFSLPGIPYASLGPDKPDASDAFRLSAFDSAEGVSGSSVGITDVIDTTS